MSDSTPDSTSDNSSDTGTRPAGEGLTDEQMVQQVADQTSSDLKAEDVFARESEGTETDQPVADVSADDLA